MAVRRTLKVIADHVTFDLTHSRYAYRNYSDFRGQFFDELSLTDQIAKIQPAPFDLSDLDLSVVFPTGKNQIHRDIRRMIENLIIAGFTNNLQVEGGQEIYDNLVLDAVETLTAVQRWAESKNNPAIVAPQALTELKNAISHLKTKDPNIIRQKVGTEVGKIMESLLVRMINENPNDKSSFARQMANKGIKNAHAQLNLGTAGGIRDATFAELDSGELIKSRKSSHPLVDITIKGTKNLPDGKEAEIDLNFSVKNPVSPNSVWTKGMSGSWKTIIVRTMQDLSDHPRWGLTRLLDFLTTIPSEVYRHMVHHNIANIIMGEAHDTADYMVYKGKIISLSDVVKVILKTTDPFGSKILEASPSLKGAGTLHNNQQLSADQAVATFSKMRSISWQMVGEDGDSSAQTMSIKWHFQNVMNAIPKI